MSGIECIGNDRACSRWFRRFEVYGRCHSFLLVHIERLSGLGMYTCLNLVVVLLLRTGDNLLSRFILFLLPILLLPLPLYFELLLLFFKLYP